MEYKSPILVEHNGDVEAVKHEIKHSTMEELRQKYGNGLSTIRHWKAKWGVGPKIFCRSHGGWVFHEEAAKDARGNARKLCQDCEAKGVRKDSSVVRAEFEWSEPKPQVFEMTRKPISKDRGYCNIWARGYGQESDYAIEDFGGVEERWPGNEFRANGRTRDDSELCVFGLSASGG